MTVNEPGAEYPSNGERAIFFARGVLEAIEELHRIPSIIHCQEWMGAVTSLYVKTAYKDEPSSTNTRVISSLLQTQLETGLGTNFKRCMQFEGAKLDLFKPYNEKFDFSELGKLTIDYGDSITEAGADVSERLLKYCADKELPFLKYSGSDSTKAYQEFYDLVLQK